jgi:Cellulase (glycosyl hydrolase family 5)
LGSQRDGDQINSNTAINSATMRLSSFVFPAVLRLILVLGLAGAAQGSGISRQGTHLLWNGQPIQLVGYSYYGLLGDRSFDAEAFLKLLAANNINFTRFFLILPWPVQPGPNRLPFAKTNGLYNLRAFDENYFSHLRRVVTRAERLGIVCQVCLFDRCGLAMGDRPAWTHNPYNAECNINGLLAGGKRGYPAFCQTTGPISKINAAFIRKVVATIGDRSNVIYEIMNEPYPELGPLQEWHAWAAAALQENLRGRPGSKVIASTGPFDDPRIDVFSMHRAGDEAHVRAAVRQAEAMNKPVILSDDGDLRCLYHPDVMVASARRALDLGQPFEHLEFTLTLQREKEKRPANTLDAIPGHCQLNLRNLSELSLPLLDRPFVRRGGLKRGEQGYSLNLELARFRGQDRVLGEHSVDGGRTWLPLPLAVKGDSVSTGPLPYKRGGRNLVRVVLEDADGVRWPGPAYPYGPTDEWSIVLDRTIVEAGLFRVRPNVPDGLIRPAVRDGENCYEVDTLHGGKYAYFRLDSSFPRKDSPHSATIQVRYFYGKPGAELILEYDGIPGAYTAAPSILMEGTGSWRAARFEIDDARFGGSQNDGADFRLSLKKSEQPMAITSVVLGLPAQPSEN